MAKALLGFAGPDPRLHSRLADENWHLRQRVADLEAALAAAEVENEALAALAAHAQTAVLEPA